jgi:Flp pilus assembly protein TadD
MHSFAELARPESSQSAMMPSPMPMLPAATLRGRLKTGALLVPIILGLTLAGCAKPQSAVDPTVTGALAQPLTQEDFDKAVTYWGQRYQADSKSKDVALNYGAALQRTGRSDQAVAVLQKAAIFYPDDRDVLAAFGKALAATGDLPRALATIEQAQTPDKPDWKLLSAQAAILDQMGRNDDARKLYKQALDIAPGEPSILSNYGMSFVLTGELPQAEKLLRQAMASPQADSRVRQNLALVVGLEGRFDEAEKIASAELSPAQAEANVAYLKQMLAQQNSWQKLKTKQTG